MIAKVADFSDKIYAITRTQAKFITPVPRVDNTLLRRIIFVWPQVRSGSVSYTTACPRRRQLSPKAGIAARRMRA
jgi:hypothetical protein